MIETNLTGRMIACIAFTGLCLIFIFGRLLPLETMPGHLPGPDLMLCLTICWVIRRPDLIPIWLLVTLFLFADMLLTRPPGLATAFVVIATEMLRVRHRRLRGMPFVVEWAMVTGLIAAIVTAQWAVLEVLFVDQPGLATQLVQVPMTALAYPLIVAMSHYVLGIRRLPRIEGFGRGARE